VITNYRRQLMGSSSPYTTGTISFDSKLMSNLIPENSVLGIGAMLMYDQAMDNALKSTYASLNISYDIQLAESNSGGVHKLGVGIGGSYGHRMVDYSSLTFSEQFNGNGFDMNLPNGEYSLSTMKPYYSSNAGLLYSYSSEMTNLDLGVAGYHLNKPEQTFLQDQNQHLPSRLVAHANLEHVINEQMVWNTNIIFMKQGVTDYFSVGSSIGYFLTEEKEIMVNAGLWYWKNNSIIPYMGISWQQLQMGFSFDILTSKLNQAAQKSSAFEFSLIFRGDRGKKTKHMYVIPCPWK